MSKPIKISYIWNRENVEKLFEASYKYQFNNSAKRFIGWFFIALMQYGVVVALKKEAFAILLFSTIVLFYWYYGKKWIAKRRARKSFEKSEFKDRRIEISIDRDGFTLLEPNQEKWSWDEIQEVVLLGDDIMLYRHPHFHYIPANGFESLEEKSRFKSLVKKIKSISREG
jgi:membrane protein implicated in regulation of membrane protease activity